MQTNITPYLELMNMSQIFIRILPSQNVVVFFKWFIKQKHNLKYTDSLK